MVNRTQQCLRISGQVYEQECGNKKAYGAVDTKCGIGSIATMQALETVERVSWWNTHQENRDGDAKTDNAMLVNSTGELYPAGRAISNGLLNSTNCDL